MKEKKTRATLATSGIVIILLGLFCNSMLWLDGVAAWHKFFVAFICIAGFVGIPALVYLNEPAYNFVDHQISKIMRLLRWVRNNYSVLLFEISIYGLIVLCTLLLDIFILSKAYGETNHYRLTFLIAMVTAVYILIRLYKVIANRVEIVFAALALILGMGTILASPRFTAYTWDDDIHYARAVSLASVFDFVKYDADKVMLENDVFITNMVSEKTFSAELFDANSALIEEVYDDQHAAVADVLNRDDNIGYDTKLGTYSIAYVAPAVAIIIAKGLRLSYGSVFIVGKLGILLSYIGIIYFAIKRVKSGKMLIALIALSPTALMMASTYSYDWWVTAWIIAAYSFYISELQKIDEPIKIRNLLSMWICIIIGIVPKWIYIILALPFMFILGKKFNSRKFRLSYYGLFIVVAIVGYAILIHPALHGAIGQGDLRGGEDISPFWQLFGIYVNPLAYAKVLLSNMANYLSPLNCTMYLSEYAFLGHSNSGYIIGIFILIMGLLDGSEKQYRGVVSRSIVLISVFVLVSATMTIFYLTYTPVASTVINGCQPRYLIPCILPVMYAIGIDGLKRVKIEPIAFAGLMATILIYSYDFWNLYIKYL